MHICLFSVHIVHFEVYWERDIDVKTCSPRAERQLQTYSCCLDVGIKGRLDRKLNT